MGRDSTFIDSQFGGRRDQEPDFTANLVGVFMSFAHEKDEFYSLVSSCCKQLGLRSERVDHWGGSGVVLRDIAELIEQAEFLIFDLTGERPNVYYELGYAHGVGNEPHDILLLAEEGTRLHYDVAGLRVKYYRDMNHLKSIVTKSLDMMMRETR